MTEPIAAAPQPAPPSPEPAKKPSALRSTLLVSAGTMASRLLGLVREQLFAALLGAGYFADAFVVAFRIPNLLRDLFAEGALSAAFVPTFAKVEKEQGKAAAFEVANKVIGALSVIVGALTLLGIAFAGPLVSVLAPGFADEPGKAELTALLAQVMMPFLLVVSAAALMMGMLNARGQFGRPALAPALFNLAAIGVGAGLKIAGLPARQAVLGWALGTLLGGILQFAVQLPPLWRAGYSLRPRLTGVWRDESVRRIARLMAPATLGLAATQVNIFVNTQFASTVPGANSWLNYAFRLMYLPIGIFGVAIATVTASSLARKAAEKDLPGMKAGLSQGMRLVAFLTVPSTVGLVVLAQPIIGLIYEHGRFQASDTQATAVALVGYAVGLYAYSGVKVAAPAFYALDKTRVPLIASASAVLANVVLNVVAFRWIGYLGLALGTSLGALVNLLILNRSFAKLTKDVPSEKGAVGQFGKVVGAAALMGAAVWSAVWGFDRTLGALGVDLGGTVVQAARVVGGVLLGAGVYAVACKLLKVREMDELLAGFRRRASRRAGAAKA